MYSFDIAYEPWIPVRVGGRLELYSLEQTLLQAQDIERLEDASPLVTVALHRFLLAVLYRALKGPESVEESTEWLEAGAFPREAVRGYLKKWGDKGRFDLFDSKRPFYQVADLDKAVFKNLIEPKSWTELSPEVRDGGQAAHIFNHENRLPEPIRVEVALRTLLTRQTFALGGLSRTFEYSAKRSPSPNAIFFIPHGKNLLETLIYCLDPKNYALYKYDIPFWERENPYDIAFLNRVNKEEVMGCAQAYTWSSRSIKLIPSVHNGKLCVEAIYFASGITPKFKIEHYYDPMVGAQIAQTGTYKGQHVFTRFRRDRQFWRDFHSLLPVSRSDGALIPRVIGNSVRLAREFSEEVHIAAYGISNATQEAKIDFSRQEYYLLPEAVSADRTKDVYALLTDTLEQAETLGKSLNTASRTLARKLLSHGGRDPDKDDVTRLVNSFPTYATYWGTLGKTFPELLGRLTADFKPKEIRHFWTEQLMQASNRAWALTREAAGDDAFALRAIYSAEGGFMRARKKLRDELEPLKENV